MKKYLTKERVMLIIGLCILIIGLTGCTGGEDSYKIPLNKNDISEIKEISWE